MGTFFLSLLVSIVLHLLLAMVLMACPVCAPEQETAATLDLTGVELSFAETVDESAAVAPLPPSSPPTPPKPSVGSPPEPKMEDSPYSVPVDVTFPEPEEEPPELREVVPPASAAPRQARVDAPPKPQRSIRPDYPRESRVRGEHGDVTLEIDVAADGSVSEVRVVGSPGFVLLEEAAVKAARAACFTPAQSGGKSVPSTVRLTLAFKLK